MVAVDWALSKERWEAEKVRMEESQSASLGGLHVEADDASSLISNLGSVKDQHGSEKIGDNEDSCVESSSSEDGAGDEMDENASYDSIEPTSRPTLPTTDVGTTLFVRNVPFGATEDELRTLYDFQARFFLFNFVP